MKRLSIVVPIYNSEKYIDTFLEDILKQINVEEDEIVLVDDGSTDNSNEICKNYQDKYKNIIRFYTITNSGPSKARNIGIQEAEGKYLFFLDIDDTIENDYIEQLLKHIQNYDLVICGYNLIKVDKNESVKVNMQTQIINKDNIMNLLQNDMMLNTLWNKAYRLDIIKKNKIKFDEKEFRGEDLLFNLDYIANIKNDVYVTDSILYNYFMKSTGLNLGYRENIITKFRRTNKTYKKMIKITNRYRNKILYMTIKSYIHHIIFLAKSIIKNIISK